MAETETRRLVIEVDTKNAGDLRDTAKELGLLNNRVKSLAGNMSFLTNVFRSWMGLQGIGYVTRLADSMQNLENRLKIVTSDGKSSAYVLEQIFDISQRTYQPIQNIGDAYVRLASALKQAKLNTAQLSALTETLVNTFRVAGTTVTETNNTMVQLAQSFSSGEVRGQELRSVLEQNAVIAGYLKEEYKGDIFKKAMDGAIRASDIVRLLNKNFDQLYEQSKKLTPTFENTLAVSMNSAAMAIHKLNRATEISAKFFTLVAWSVNNLDIILASLAVGALPLVVANFSMLASAVVKASVALRSFFLTNPIGWAILAAGAVATLVISLGGLRNTFDWVSIAVLKLFSTWMLVQEKIWDVLGKNFISKSFAKGVAEADEKIKSLRAGIDKRNKEAAGEDEKNRKEQMKKALREAEELLKLLGGKNKAPKVKEWLAAINAELQTGRIDAGQYAEKLQNFEIRKLNKELNEGKINIFQFHEGLSKVNLEELNRQLASGAISLKEFGLYADIDKLKLLEEQFAAGRISLEQYNAEIIKLEDKFRPGAALQSGAESYIKSVGSLSQNIAKGVEQAFGHLEENLVEMTKTGKFNFDQFTKAILEDLTKIIIRASIIKPLAEGLLNRNWSGTATPSTGQSYTNVGAIAANGMAFNSSSNVIPFAKGGIVGSPTGFSFGGGRRGIMGEAGPEAILPLGRDSAGKLGVQASVTPVQINIINQTGASVQQTESTGTGGEKIIDVLITTKVKQGLASGVFDKQMANSYGITRKGS